MKEYYLIATIKVDEKTGKKKIVDLRFTEGSLRILLGLTINKR